MDITIYDEGGSKSDRLHKSDLQTYLGLWHLHHLVSPLQPGVFPLVSPARLPSTVPLPSLPLPGTVNTSVDTHKIN